MHAIESDQDDDGILGAGTAPAGPVPSGAVPVAPRSVANQLERLAADAEDIRAMLTRHHDQGGDLHPQALPKAAALQTSLRDIVNALVHHEHLVMDADDVWALFNPSQRRQAPGAGA